MSLVVLLAACRDETNTGGGSEGGNPSDGGNGPSNGGGGNPPADGGNGAGPSNGGGGQGAGAGPSNGGGGNGPQGGFGGDGGMGPQGGFGGEGGAPPAGETNCIDNIDNDGDTDTDCLDLDCQFQAVCGDLVINEIDYDNVGAGDADEFLEIYNNGLDPIDLDGLSVYRINGSTGAPYGGATGIALTGTLGVDEYLVLASSTTVVDPAATVILWGAATNNLQNGNPDGVAIYDANHQVLIDSFAYGGALTNAMIDGQTFDLTEMTAATAQDSNVQAISLIRFPNGVDTNNADADWSTTTIITPGAENQQAFVAETNCSDGIDNNSNGDIDCDDVDCDGLSCDANGSTCDTLVCTCPGGTTESICGDGNDNDCDGDIDCADANCTGSPACAEDCDDGVDNNGDSLADCLDPLCAGQVCGPNGLTCAANVCACPGGATEILCGDTVDNDCDGQIDCADTNCAASCVAPVLFFSEYVEGSSNRKALEIYNNGALPADLSQCTLNRYSNGGTAPTAIALTGTLAAGDTFVICNSMGVQPGDAMGIPAANCDTTSTLVNHNGNDAYDLTCSGTMVDFVGQFGVGTDWGVDVTLRRNCSVLAGHSTPTVAYDPTEWTSQPVNTFGGLNARSCPLNP